MNQEQAELYQRIENFRIDDPNAEYPLSQRLARENNWSNDYTKKVIAEYKKFAFLSVVVDHPVTPSADVDQAWHLHLIYTHSYWDNFCDEILGKRFHHVPSKGGTKEREKFYNIYRKTLASYEAFFGQKPPEDIWSCPEERFGIYSNITEFDITDNENRKENKNPLIFQANDLLNNNYQLHTRLGHTAKGRQTWLASHIYSGEFVVIKLLAFSPELDWKELELFEREAEILKQLKHPRIPRYQDYFEIDKERGYGVPWLALVQEYIDGQSLQDLLDRNKRFSEDELRSIIEQVLEILSYLHDLNPIVLHRDIKPSNLILGENNQIYLVDFGSVQAQASVTGVTFSLVGTGGYAPLEQFLGRANISSDLYALGATIIHLATGFSPVELYGNDRINFRDKVNLATDFITWLETATEPVLEKRFNSAKEALENLKLRIILKNDDWAKVKVKISSEELNIITYYINPKTQKKFKNTPPRILEILKVIDFFNAIFCPIIAGLLLVYFSHTAGNAALVKLFLSLILNFVWLYFISNLTTIIDFKVNYEQRYSGYNFYFNDEIFIIKTGSRVMIQGCLNEIIDFRILNNKQLVLETRRALYLSDYLSEANLNKLEIDIRNWLTKKGVKLIQPPEPDGCCGCGGCGA